MPGKQKTKVSIQNQRKKENARLAARGREARARNDHRRARRLFEAIPKGERIASDSAQLGATYADLAYENLILNKDDDFWLDAIANLNDAIKKNPNYRWAWAQMGETYRRMANAYSEIPGQTHQVVNTSREATTLQVVAYVLTQNKGATKFDFQACLSSPDFPGYLEKKPNSLKDLYAQAEECFEEYFKQAIPDDSLDEQDAWALVHWGATIVNSRGRSGTDAERIEAYNEALAKFERALKLKNQRYPWCWAFKFAAHVLLNVVHTRRGDDTKHDGKQARYHAEQAYQSLFIAIIQDKNLFDKIDVPLGAFGEEQPRMLLYAKAMVMYARGTQQWREYESSELYQSYFYAVSRIYEERDEKLSDAEIREIITTVDLKSSDSAILDNLLKKWNWTEELPSDATMYSKLNQLLNAQPAQKEWLHLFYIKGGLKALELEMEGSKENDEVKKAALECLAASLTLAPDDKLRDQARSDAAWYHLRGDGRFLKLIGAKQA